MPEPIVSFPIYILRNCDDSIRCHRCGRAEQRLLCPDDYCLTLRGTHPSFYLCACGNVHQIPAGDVKNLDEED